MLLAATFLANNLQTRYENAQRTHFHAKSSFYESSSSTQSSKYLLEKLLLELSKRKSLFLTPTQGIPFH